MQINEWIDPQGSLISYIDRGEGNKVLFFIHGLTDNHETWELNIDFFSKYYRCIAIDLPGHGLSKSPAFSYDLESYAAKVRSLITHLQLEQLILVGHSMGGQIAILLADSHPRLIEKLILSAPAGFEEFSDEERKRLISLVLTGSQAGGGLNSTAGIRNYFFDSDHQLIKRFGTQLESALAKTLSSPAQIIGKSIKGMLEHPVIDGLKRLSIPVCVFFGEDDNLIPNRFLHPELTTEKVARHGTSLIADAELHLFKRCGHLPHLEQYTQFNLQAYKFLNKELYG